MQKSNFPRNSGRQLQKRPPPKAHTRPNDLYITNKTDFHAQFKQCESFLSNPDFGEVFIHCIGGAITKGINLALQIQKKSNDLYQLEINTSTIALIDDLHPLNDEDDFTVQKRNNSAIHIRIFSVSKAAEKKE